MTEFIATAILRASLLFALGLAALRWLPAGRPQWRRAVALGCLGASLLLPFLPVLSSPVASVLGEHGLRAKVSGVDPAMLAKAFALLWIVGAVLVSLQLLGRVMALRRWTAQCEPLLLPGPLDSSLPVLVCRRAKAPCVAGFVRAVLVVPEEARAWDDATWRCVLAHELQHVRQGDLWLGWISHAVRALHWWNPLAWKLSRRAGLECEACCDDAVLRLGIKAGDYARVLLGFTTTQSPQPAAGFFIHGRTPSSLRLRLERMLAGPTAGSAGTRIVLVTLLLLGGMAGCFWLGFQSKPAAVSHAEMERESALRWQANPFPADNP